MSDHTGIAAASFISRERRHYRKLKSDNIDTLRLISQLFHNTVMSNNTLKKEFISPLIKSITHKESRLLVGLTQGSSLACIADELGTTEKYLDKVHNSVRRKLWPSNPDLPPKINRNQMLYYAGLFNLLDYL